MKKDILNSLSIIALIFAGMAMTVGLSSMQARLDRLQANVLDLQFTYEEQLNSLSASLQISEPVPLFEDAIASGISSSATSFTLIRGTDKTGTNLASSTYGFILSEGSANEEFVLADCTGTACTNVVRGYWPLTNATSSALMKTHRRGDTVKITDSPIINQMKRVINGQEDLPNALTFDGKLTYTTAPTFTSTLDIPSKAYVDNSVNQGAATSTESVGGILEIATATEIASTTTDLPNRPLALTTAYSSSTPATGTGPLVIVSKINRKLDQLWLDLTEAFTVTGAWIFNGTATFNGATSYTATSTATGKTIGYGNQSYMTASTTITGFTLPQPVYVATSTGAVQLSDANSEFAKEFIGFAVTSATDGEQVLVQTDGVIGGFTGLTAGREYYVQDAVGTIGTTVGTAAIYVGQAISSTQINIDTSRADEYLGVSTSINSGGSIAVPAYTNTIIANINSSETDFTTHNTVVLKRQGILSGTVANCDIGTGNCSSTASLTITWNPAAGTLTGSGSTGGGTAYFYR